MKGEHRVNLPMLPMLTASSKLWFMCCVPALPGLLVAMISSSVSSAWRDSSSRSPSDVESWIRLVLFVLCLQDVLG